MIEVPEYALSVLQRLSKHGFEAFVVGGCVRDSLLGKKPKDWDITTSALPEESKALFADMPVLETGIRHGTVTVLSAGRPVEVTTYRVDGPYTDGRHPDRVCFTRSLREDLARRDFTINAMAYHPEVGLVDYFSGQADLAARRICCVGDPELRFREDALRILRALRFASVLGFQIEKVTAACLLAQKELLGQIAAERIAVEMSGLLCGRNVLPVLMDYAPVITYILPELAPMVGHPQHNAYHRYDIYEHTARCVAAAPPLPVLRWTMLFHDSGKPACYTLDEAGVGHFYGHPAVSVQLANQALQRLKLDKDTIEQVCTLITYHDVRLPEDPKVIRRWLHRLGEERFGQLLDVQKADISGQNPDLLGRIHDIDRLGELAGDLLAQDACYSLRNLRINGYDLMKLGVRPGKRLGELLESLLGAVIDGRCPNEHEALLCLAKQLLQGNESDPG